MSLCSGRHEPLGPRMQSSQTVRKIVPDDAGRLDGGEAPSNPPGGGSLRLRPASAWAAPGRAASGHRRIAGKLEVAVEVGVGRRRVVRGRAAGLPPKRSGLGTSPHRRAEGRRLCAVASFAWDSLRPAPRCRPCPNRVLQQVRRTGHAVAAAVEHMGVDHRCLDIPVAEALLGQSGCRSLRAAGFDLGQACRWRCWRGRSSSERFRRGRLGIHCGVPAIECGASAMECGAAAIECGDGAFQCGAAAIECGAPALQCGAGAMDCGAPAMDCGAAAVDSRGFREGEMSPAEDAGAVPMAPRELPMPRPGFPIPCGASGIHTGGSPSA